MGSSHLKTEPTVKKTTQFYHPKENREKNLKADSKLPGFYDGDENQEDASLKKSETYDQFSFWREPVADIIEDLQEEEDEKSEEALPNTDPEKIDEGFLADLNKFLLKRPFLSGFEVTEVDFAVLNILRKAILEENLHLNVIRWKQNIQTHDIMNADEVDVARVMEFVRNEDDFTVEDTHYDDQDIAETAETDSNDHGYDSDKENDNDEEDDDDGWITPGNLKSKKAALNGVSEEAKPERVKVREHYFFSSYFVS